jgi:hypothetical protein
MFKAGDIVVHTGGTSGIRSRNRGMVLTILEGPLRIVGLRGYRYIVDRPLYLYGQPIGESPTMYSANAEYLFKLK